MSNELYLRKEIEQQDAKDAEQDVRDVRKTQIKILASNITSAGNVPGLTFNNLVTGKWYRLYGQMRMFSESNNGVITNINENSNNLASYFHRNNDGNSQPSVQGVHVLFKATGTDVEVNLGAATASAYLAGNNTRSQSWLGIEELNYEIVETTDWT